MLLKVIVPARYGDHRGFFCEPASTQFRGLTVLECPPNTHGVAVLRALDALEPHALDPQDPRQAAFMLAIRRSSPGASYAPYQDGVVPWHAAMAATYAHATAPLRRLVDLAKWGHAVDGTSHRAGFVVCGDLEVAARMIQAEPVTVGGPQARDKVKDLVLYSISEEYFAVRDQLGLKIG